MITYSHPVTFTKDQCQWIVDALVFAEKKLGDMISYCKSIKLAVPMLEEELVRVTDIRLQTDSAMKLNNGFSDSLGLESLEIIRAAIALSIQDDRALQTDFPSHFPGAPVYIFEMFEKRIAEKQHVIDTALLPNDGSPAKNKLQSWGFIT